MKRLFRIGVPKTLLIIGWLTIFAELLMSYIGKTLGQNAMNSGITMFTIGAFPVLLYVLKSMSNELSNKS